MQVLNKLHHTDEQWSTLAAMEDEGPVFMTNLLKFKDRAEYPDGRATELSGMEAYQLYGAETMKHIAAIGGRVVHSSVVMGLIAGEVEDLWDVVAIVEYPSIKKFITMIESDEWQAHAVHREAGLAGQLNIISRTPPQ